MKHGFASLSEGEQGKYNQVSEFVSLTILASPNLIPSFPSSILDPPMSLPNNDCVLSIICYKNGEEQASVKRNVSLKVNESRTWVKPGFIRRFIPTFTAGRACRRKHETFFYMECQWNALSHTHIWRQRQSSNQPAVRRSQPVSLRQHVTAKHQVPDTQPSQF